MPKALIVAQSEFVTLVKSKAFLVGLVLMPVVMGTSIMLVRATKDATDMKDRTFAIVDYTGVVAEPLKSVAAMYNSGTPSPMDAVLPRKGARFIPVEIKPSAGENADALRLDLSNRVRKQEFFAFVEVPAEILDPVSTVSIRYYSDHPSYNALPQWLRATVNAVVLNERFRRASVDRALVVRLTKQAPIDELGLFERGAAGEIKPAEQVNAARAYGIPLAVLVLMYITIMTSAPQLLNSVIEEKLSRISEVLIGSVTPFELMMGKLLGGAATSILMCGIYITGGLVVVQNWGYASALTPAIVTWFLVFLTLALFIFGSLFVAIGAACSDLKDSQNMMTPVMLLVMIPVFTAGSVLRAPDGTMATVLSLVPTAAPFLMLLRISLQPGPPIWQIVLSIFLMTCTALVVVWAAGKIFRTGLLMQGKSASFTEMVKWVREK